MGQVIERIAKERGHEIVLKKDENNTYEGLSTADVAIDFSVPAAAVSIPIVFVNVPAGILGTSARLDHENAQRHRQLSLSQERPSSTQTPV
jgi:4-hydroxy-tetrahydrodipicolinate reductase